MTATRVSIPAYCILRTSVSDAGVCEVGYCRELATSRMVIVRPSLGLVEGLVCTCLCEACAEVVELATGSTQPRPPKKRGRKPRKVPAPAVEPLALPEPPLAIRPSPAKAIEPGPIQSPEAISEARARPKEEGERIGYAGSKVDPKVFW